MKYDDFIKTLERFQTKRIKAHSFASRSCAIENIPQEFETLLPDIIQILDKNIYKFCDNNKIIVLFGMQFGPPMLQSELPRLLNRIHNYRYPREHFCCVLQYLISDPSTASSLQSWHGMQSIVLDFTTGLLMDSDSYLNIFDGKPADGTIYGEINHSKLNIAWKNLHERTNKSNYYHYFNDASLVPV